MLPGCAALQALADKWPDEATHALLASGPSEAPHPAVRTAALQALARKWTDEARAPCWNSGPSRMTTTIPAAPRFRRWPRSGRMRPRAPCWNSGPSRIRTIRCGARFFALGRCTPSLAASCQRETWMALCRTSIRCNRFHAITSNWQPQKPASVPRTSTPKSRRSRLTSDGTSPAAQSHRVKKRSEENVPERGVNSTHGAGMRIWSYQPWAENRLLAIGKEPECPPTKIASHPATSARSRESRSASQHRRV